MTDEFFKSCDVSFLNSDTTGEKQENLELMDSVMQEPFLVS